MSFFSISWVKNRRQGWLKCQLSPAAGRYFEPCWWLLVSVSLTLQGIFLNFQEHLLCIYSTLVFKKLFFTVLQQQTAFLRGKVPAINILLSEHKSGQTRQAANNLLLAREHSPDVNNKPISIPYLEQGYR